MNILILLCVCDVQIQELHLVDCNLSDEDALTISKYIEKFTSLSVLSLRNNEFTGYGIERICMVNAMPCCLLT